MAHTITKKPWERFPVSINFSKEMETSETIAAGLSECTVDSATTDNPIVDVNSITVVDNTRLQVIVYGGIVGMGYKLNMRAYISADKKLEDDLFIFVSK